VARTLIDIPDELMAEAREVLGGNVTKAETVRRALAELVAKHRQMAMIDWLESTRALDDLNDPAVRASARR
jgi:Arc/MetJ family transcription regulator